MKLSPLQNWVKIAVWDPVVLRAIAALRNKQKAVIDEKKIPHLLDGILHPPGLNTAEAGTFRPLHYRIAPNKPTEPLEGIPSVQLAKVVLGTRTMKQQEIYNKLVNRKLLATRRPFGKVS